MKPITYYQASNLSDEEVKSQFIVRRKEFERVMAEIRRDDMKGSIQNYIFIGQRGSGKSTLLRRIQAEVNTEDSLSRKIVAINLSEEQAGIYRLHDLWERVAEELDIRGYQVENVEYKIYGSDLKAYAKAMYYSVQSALRKASKTLLLLLDNIDRILENIKEDDNHLLRELLMNYKDVRIIGGSTRLSEHHWDYSQPFYEFFSIIRLESLTENELRELLVFWGSYYKEPALAKFVKNSPGKLNAIRLLSDGMPRTMLYLVELLVNRPEQKGYEYLRYIVDRATPVYQERLGLLPALQQKIVLELSFFWDAVKVKELAQTTHCESKVISAVLNQLVDMMIVEKVRGVGKNHRYRLRERFFNLWLIMTQGGPKQKSQVKWLTIFLQTWYDNEELRALYARFAQELQTRKVSPDRALLLAKALVHSSCLSLKERDNLLDLSSELLGDHNELLPLKSEKIYKNAIELIDMGKYSDAITALKDIEQEDDKKIHLFAVIKHKQKEYKSAEKLLLSAKNKKSGRILYTLGRIYFDTGRYDEAESVLLECIQLGGRNALNLLGLVYTKLNRFDEAEILFNRYLENKASGAGFNNLGNLYKVQGKFEEAEQNYLKALELGSLNAIANLGILYEQKQDIEKAKEFYLMAIEKGHLNAMNQLGLLFVENENWDNAEYWFSKAWNAGDEDALVNLANVYDKKGKYKEAEKFYKKSIAKGEILAFNNLGLLYLNTDRVDEAIECFEEGAHKGDEDAMYHLSVLYYFLNENPVRSKQLMSDYLEKVPADLKAKSFMQIIKLWSGDSVVKEDVVQIISQAANENKIELMEHLFTQLLSHFQTNMVWEILNSEQNEPPLKEIVKPSFYACLSFMTGPDREDEMLSMPPEIMETVKEIREDIIERQKYYYNQSIKTA